MEDEKKIEIKNEESENKSEIVPEDVEIQTTFNEDGFDILCEDADVENEEKGEE